MPLARPPPLPDDKVLNRLALMSRGISTGMSSGQQHNDQSMVKCVARLPTLRLNHSTVISSELTYVSSLAPGNFSVATGLLRDKL